MGVATMISRTIGLAVLCGFLMTGVAVRAHHAVAGIYDLNKEVVLLGKLKKLNFVNPHASIVLSSRIRRQRRSWTGR
jgi:hypothetical protein